MVLTQKTIVAGQQPKTKLEIEEAIESLNLMGLHALLLNGVKLLELIEQLLLIELNDTVTA